MSDKEVCTLCGHDFAVSGHVVVWDGKCPKCQLKEANRSLHGNQAGNLRLATDDTEHGIELAEEPAAGDSDIENASDAGEPSGSSKQPIKTQYRNFFLKLLTSVAFVTIAFGTVYYVSSWRSKFSNDHLDSDLPTQVELDDDGQAEWLLNLPNEETFEYGIKNGDFSEQLEYWTLEGGADQFRVFTLPLRKTLALTTFGTSDENTGRIYQAFTIPPNAHSLTFFVHGGAGDGTFVALVIDGDKFYNSHGPKDQSAIRELWDVRTLRNQRVVLEVCDYDTQPQGFIGVHGFQILNDLEVASLPTMDERITTIDNPEKGPDRPIPEITRNDLERTLMAHHWHYYDNLYPPGDLCTFRLDGTWHKWKWGYEVVSPREMHVYFNRSKRDRGAGIPFFFDQALTSFSGEFTDGKGRRHLIKGTRQ